MSFHKKNLKANNIFLSNDENNQFNIESNNSIDISNEEGDDSSNEDNQNILYVDEFKPKIINNRNNKKKEIIKSLMVKIMN